MFILQKKTFKSLITSYTLQYSQRHSVTLLSDTDISFGLFNLFTYFNMPFG